MVNEIPTLLANHPATGNDKWYIDPNFAGVRIPPSIRYIYNILIGDDADTSVMCLMSVLNCVDIQKYKYAFDSRELFDNISNTSIYDLYKNKINTDWILDSLSVRDIDTLFSGDKYLQTLADLFKLSNESTLRLCSIILALAYRLKLELIKQRGK